MTVPPAPAVAPAKVAVSWTVVPMATDAPLASAVPLLLSLTICVPRDGDSLLTVNRSEPQELVEPVWTASPL